MADLREENGIRTIADKIASVSLLFPFIISSLHDLSEGGG